MMRALPATAGGRGAVACATAPVPRRSLLLSAAAGGLIITTRSTVPPPLQCRLNSGVCVACFFHSLQAGAALNAEQLPLRLPRGAAGAAAKIRASAATFSSTDDALAWAKKDNRRRLHVVYRVGYLDKTIKFYTECLGMKMLRKRDIPEEKYTNAFLGYRPEDSHFVVELTYSF
ncbi:hypothetical protein PVAP13_1KG169300 [Panicum virgatum]|uniref:VOC domain-containing protein n=1 Tax=Panicum virgatum TaxID=38727 RepID=A0A8T0X857_PANVG|nr:hypothetical protein PVAP13_1KG169300 [Panicum virgatum]